MTKPVLGFQKFLSSFAAPAALLLVIAACKEPGAQVQNARARTNTNLAANEEAARRAAAAQQGEENAANLQIATMQEQTKRIQSENERLSAEKSDFLKEGSDKEEAKLKLQQTEAEEGGETKRTVFTIIKDVGLAMYNGGQKAAEFMFTKQIEMAKENRANNALEFQRENADRQFFADQEDRAAKLAIEREKLARDRRKDNRELAVLMGDQEKIDRREALQQHLKNIAKPLEEAEKRNRALALAQGIEVQGDVDPQTFDLAKELVRKGDKTGLRDLRNEVTADVEKYRDLKLELTDKKDSLIPKNSGLTPNPEGIAGYLASYREEFPELPAASPKKTGVAATSDSPPTKDGSGPAKDKGSTPSTPAPPATPPSADVANDPTFKALREKTDAFLATLPDESTSEFDKKQFAAVYKDAQNAITPDATEAQAREAIRRSIDQLNPNLTESQKSKLESVTLGKFISDYAAVTTDSEELDGLKTTAGNLENSFPTDLSDVPSANQPSGRSPVTAFSDAITKAWNKSAAVQARAAASASASASATATAPAIPQPAAPVIPPSEDQTALTETNPLDYFLCSKSDAANGCGPSHERSEAALKKMYTAMKALKGFMREWEYENDTAKRKIAEQNAINSYREVLNAATELENENFMKTSLVEAKNAANSGRFLAGQMIKIDNIQSANATINEIRPNVAIGDDYKGIFTEALARDFKYEIPAKSMAESFNAQLQAGTYPQLRYVAQNGGTGLGGSLDIPGLANPTEKSGDYYDFLQQKP